MPIAFAYTLIVLLILSSIILTLLVLLHRGKGGGMSSMFGGGVTSSLAGSSVAEKNLDRYTVLVGIVWFACIVGLGLWLKVAQTGGCLNRPSSRRLCRAVRSSGSRGFVSPAASTVALPQPGGDLLRRQERHPVSSGSAIRGSRVGSEPHAAHRA